MKKNDLLKIQQYINHVGFILVLISSTLFYSVASGDAFFPSQMPILPLSSANQLVVANENEYLNLIKMDYHSENDSLCVQANDQCISLDDNSLGIFLDFGHSPSKRKQDIIDLRVQKDIPYKYVKKLFDNLRFFNCRKILLRTNAINEIGGITGVKIFLPPFIDQILEKQYAGSYIPQIVIEKKHKKNIRPIHIHVNQSGALFYNDKECLSQENLHTNLKNEILDFQSKNKEIYIWFEIDEAANLQQFLETYTTIRLIYNNLWDEISLMRYGKKMTNLNNEEQKGDVRRSLPFNLVWMDSNEYQFFENSKGKRK